MKIINNISSLKNELNKNSKNIGLHRNQSIGFVPTMGALHDGHISLIKKAKKQNKIVIVSIFVNPTQFLVGEDLDKYPKKDAADKKICELLNIDYLFMPDVNTMYDENEVLVKAPNKKGFILEGQKRPGHFDGMLQIILKLFNIVNPKNAYFGKKDAQQLSLITQMVKNFYLDINIVACDIVREADGLAMSSRNIYLTSDERKKALNISKVLKISAKTIGTGQKDCRILIKQIYNTLSSVGGINIDYIAIVDKNFNKIDFIEIKNTIILIAVKIGSTRLIDNIWI